MYIQEHYKFDLRNTRPKNELFLGIFHTIPVKDIHMILFGLDKSTFEVCEKKNFIHFT